MNTLVPQVIAAALAVGLAAVVSASPSQDQDRGSQPAGREASGMVPAGPTTPEAREAPDPRLQLFQSRPELHIREPSPATPAAEPRRPPPLEEPQRITPDPYVRVEDRTKRPPDEPPASAPAAPTGLSAALATRTAGELIGMDIVDGTSQRIGPLKKVVRETGSGRLFAVAATGGLFGLGARDVAVPLDGMDLADGRLAAAHGSSAEPYDGEGFSIVSAGTVLGEVAAPGEVAR